MMIGKKSIIKLSLDSSLGRAEYEKLVNDPSIKILKEEVFHTNRGEANVIIRYVDTAFIEDDVPSRENGVASN